MFGDTAVFRVESSYRCKEPFSVVVSVIDDHGEHCSSLGAPSTLIRRTGMSISYRLSVRSDSSEQYNVVLVHMVCFEIWMKGL